MVRPLSLAEAQLLAAISVFVIGIFAFGIMMPILALISLAGAPSALFILTSVIGPLFPFFFVEQTSTVDGITVVHPLVEYRYFFTFVEWSLLALCNVGLARGGFSRRPVLSALALTAFAGVVTAGIVSFLGLDFSLPWD